MTFALFRTQLNFAQHWQTSKHLQHTNLSRCNLCSTRAVGDELQTEAFSRFCSALTEVQDHYGSVVQPDQDAEESLQLFIWHKNQKAVSHCLKTIMLHDSCKQPRHGHRFVQPRLAEWTRHLNGQAAKHLCSKGGFQQPSLFLAFWS